MEDSENNQIGSQRNFSSPFREFVDNNATHKDKVTEIRKGYYPLVARVLLISCILDFLLFISLWIAFSINQDTIIFVLAILLVTKFACFLYYVFSITVNWSQTYFQFDDNHLIKMVGVYNTQQTVYNLNELNSVDFQISVLGRLLKYGHLTLVFKLQDGASQRVEIPYAIEPEKLKNYLSKYLK